MNFPFKPSHRKAAPKTERRWQLDVGGQTVPVAMKHHPTAKRFILRFNKTRDGIVVTVPPAPRNEKPTCSPNGSMTGSRHVLRAGPHSYRSKTAP